MKNDTHTEQRIEWVKEDQMGTRKDYCEMSIEPLAYQGLGFENLTLDQQCILIDKLDELNEDLIEDDHTQAIRTNQLFDTLQGILDNSPNKATQIIQNLQENWIVKACMRQ
tara:strand:+ start:116 stop:448 length:333 start_codon:yes stop_codon:yes gene_type:complete